jgi:ubiquinol-cytochrome c reductase iron-sulfur subunit
MSDDGTIMSSDSTHPTVSEGLPAQEQADRPDVTHEQPDSARRRALVAATTALGGIAVAVASVPFIGSMLPSERAKAAGAPVETDISTLEPGALQTVEWQGKPVWIVRRTDEMLRLMGEDEPRLSDPQSAVPQQPAYCRNPTRSIKPGFLVTVGICTHLGCVPTFRPELAPADLGPEWHGGFYCPCHASKFDLAGRVYKNVPAPTNLVIPRHGYLSNSRLIIGTDVK